MVRQLIHLLYQTIPNASTLQSISRESQVWVMQPPNPWMKLSEWRTTTESATMLLTKQNNMQHLFYECISSSVLTELRCSHNVLDNGQEVPSLQGGQFQLPRETEQGKNQIFPCSVKKGSSLMCNVSQGVWGKTLSFKFTVQVLIAKLYFRVMDRLNLRAQILAVCSVWLSFLLQITVCYDTPGRRAQG